MLLLQTLRNSLIELDLFFPECVELLLEASELTLELIVLSIDVIRLALDLLTVEHCRMKIFLLLQANSFQDTKVALHRLVCLQFLFKDFFLGP